MGGVGPQVIVEGDPASDASLCVGPGFPSVQVDPFILQGLSEAFDEDVVEVSGFSVHRHLGLGPLQSVGPVEGGELGGFNRSSQHPLKGGCCGETETRVGTA